MYLISARARQRAFFIFGAVEVKGYGLFLFGDEIEWPGLLEYMSEGDKV